MEEKILSTLELNEVIAQKARENEEFRLALLNDPKAAIAKEFGVLLPDNTKVEVHVESPRVLHLIIPAGNADELTDDQLEDVAGGALTDLLKLIDPGKMVIVAYGVPYPGGSGWKWPF
ncbi:MAG: NHLP leader peptide family RiPP precursor [Bacillota bacterium]|jgi:peroxiredoxin